MRIRIRSHPKERLRKATYESIARHPGRTSTIDFRDGNVAMYLLDRIGQEVCCRLRISQRHLISTEIARDVKALARKVDTTHALFNTNYQDQGQWEREH